MSEHAVEVALTEAADLLDSNDLAFARRVYATDAGLYADRLKAIGFTGLDDVLDSGCGFGQWSLALARLNRRVHAQDVSPGRVRFLKKLACHLSLENLRIEQAALPETKAQDASYDAIFCYGVIFCTPYEDSLREFRRILRPGGRLYLTGNGFGYSIFRWKTNPNPTETFSPQRAAALSFLNTLHYRETGEAPQEGALIVEQEEMVAALRAANFSIVAQGGDGTIRVDADAPMPTPFFRAEYYGLPGCYEILAQRMDS